MDQDLWEACSFTVTGDQCWTETSCDRDAHRVVETKTNNPLRRAQHLVIQEQGLALISLLTPTCRLNPVSHLKSPTDPYLQPPRRSCDLSDEQRPRALVYRTISLYANFKLGKLLSQSAP